MTNLSQVVTAADINRIKAVGVVVERYDALVAADAPQEKFIELVADYAELGLKYPPQALLIKAGMVPPKIRRTTRYEYQARIIALLERGPASVRQLGRVLGRSQTQTAELVAKMAGEGMVERTGHGLAQWRLKVELQPVLIKEPA